jgi:hypothetical protein
MNRRFDIAIIAGAACVAGYVAITIGYVALHDLGLSCEQVRGCAMTAAIFIAALVAVVTSERSWARPSEPPAANAEARSL